MKGTLYQLYDVDNFECGLIYSESKNLNTDMVEDYWRKYYTGQLDKNDPWVVANPEYDTNIGPDGFADYLSEMGFEVERVFTEEIFI